jgi:hypothetical protein
MTIYENTKRVEFDCGEMTGIARFIPVCIKCGRFVKPNETIRTNEIVGLAPETNAKCKKCGNTAMIFEGFF